MAEMCKADRVKGCSIDKVEQACKKARLCDAHAASLVAHRLVCAPCPPRSRLQHRIVLLGGGILVRIAAIAKEVTPPHRAVGRSECDVMQQPVRHQHRVLWQGSQVCTPRGRGGLSGAACQHTKVEGRVPWHDNVFASLTASGCLCAHADQGGACQMWQVQ